MFVLGIETSCDETSAAVVKDGTQVLSNIVASQEAIHAPYGGIVPEIASRHHIEQIELIVNRALDKAGLTIKQIDGIAVTAKPGLLGALLVGLSYAKGLAYALHIPFVGVNHLEAHLHAIFLEKKVSYPFLGLLVSGGHTALYKIEGVGNLELLATTRDDAVGEAFDKVAKLVGLGYPGGKKVDELAKQGNANAISFPRPGVRAKDFYFSFSGLKTSVLTYLKKQPDFKNQLADICASFQEAAVDTLISQTKRGMIKTGISTVVIAGGVAANTRLRTKSRSFDAHIPSFSLCTDNAAMIAARGYHDLKGASAAENDLSLNAQASCASILSYRA